MNPLNSKLQARPGISALSLGLIAALGVLLLAGTHLSTKDRIAEQERLLVMQRLSQVLPMELYGNDLITDVIKVTDRGAFGHDQPVRVFRARQDGEPVALIMEVIAPNGYNGDIVLLLGIQYDGTITGARVIRHRETPGLGDPIEARRSDWIDGFRGRSLENPTLPAWTVRKEGGDFDQFTGATITPRAVIHAIAKALTYYDRHRDPLFAKESHHDD